MELNDNITKIIENIKSNLKESNCTMTEVEEKTFCEERALYNSNGIHVINCTFNGNDYAESCLKESKNGYVEKTIISCNYSLWHLNMFVITNSDITEKTRASLWYCNNVAIEKTKIHGAKAIRECDNISLKDCDIISDEFCWKSKNVALKDVVLKGECPFLEVGNLAIDNLTLDGKYSFQYCYNVALSNSKLKTKDAFWHAKNCCIINTTIDAEYIGWYSENLTFINCKFTGTQPFCYCKNLRFVNCEFEKGDLAFEYSDVNGNIIGHIDSIKNPISGELYVDSVSKIILEDSKYPTNCKIITKND